MVFVRPGANGHDGEGDIGDISRSGDSLSLGVSRYRDVHRRA